MGIFIVIKNNFKRNLNRKKSFMLILLIPVLAILFGVFTNYVTKPSFTLGVIMNDTFEEGNRINTLLEKTGSVKVKKGNPNTAKMDSIMAKYAVVITFNHKFEKGDVKNIDDYISFYGQDTKVTAGMKDLVVHYLQNDSAIDLKEFKKELFEENLSAGQRIIAFIVMCLFITTTVTASIMIKDKEAKTLLRVKYSPLKMYVYTLGNFIYNYLITYIQLSIAILVVAISNINIGISTSQFLMYSFLIALITTCFGTFIASIFNKELYANLFSSGISLVMALVGGAFLPIDKMPTVLKFISNLTPNKWIIEFTKYLEQGNVLTSGSYIIAILALFSVVFLVLSTALNSKKVV